MEEETGGLFAGLIILRSSLEDWEIGWDFLPEKGFCGDLLDLLLSVLEIF